MQISELTVNVSMKVTKDTAERAARILNMYLEDTGIVPKVRKISDDEERREYCQIDL